MKILVVSPVPTHPPNEGNRACIQSYCSALREEGHRVEFLYVFRPWTADTTSLSAVANAWGDNLHLFRCTYLDRIRQAIHHRRVGRSERGYRWNDLCPVGLCRRIASLMHRASFDAVIVNYWILTPAVANLHGIRRVLYTHDQFSNRLARTGSSWFTTDEATETKALDSVDAVLAIQEQEAATFRRNTTTPVFVSYTHTPIQNAPPGPVENLLFLAGANPANIAGIKSFIEDILPHIRERLPHVRLIVGGGVCDFIRPLLRDGIELVGDVYDLAFFYGKGALTVNPVPNGTGLKIKLIEALAHGRHVLSHPQCLTGLPTPHRSAITPCSSANDYLAALEPRIRDSRLQESDRAHAWKYASHLNAMCLNAFRTALATPLEPKE